VVRAGEMLGMGGVTIWFCVRRWGWVSVSIVNVMVMLVVLGTAMAAKEWLAVSGYGYTFAALVMLLGLLALGIRTRERKLVLRVMSDRLSGGMTRLLGRKHA